MNQHKSTILLVFVLVAFVTPFFSQSSSIIKVTEKDRDGNYLGKDGTPKEAFINSKIVDINSVLQIQLNKKKLIAAVAQSNKMGIPEEVVEKIEKLNSALADRNKNLKKMQAILDQYDYEDFKENDGAFMIYSSELQEISETTIKVEQIDTRIADLAYGKYETIANQSTSKAIYLAAEDVLELLEDEVKEHAKKKGVNIQFGGWIYRKGKSTPLNFPGFDSIAPQEAYEVDRWQIVPTEEQMAKLKELQEIAKENVDKGLEVLKLSANKRLDALKNFSQLQLTRLISEVEADIQEVKNTINPVPTEITTTINTIKALEADIRVFTQQVNNRLDYYRNITSINEVSLNTFLRKAKDDIDFIEKNGVVLKNKIEEIKTQINTLDSTLKTTLSSTIELFNTLSNKYTRQYDAIRALAKASFEEFLYGDKLDVAALEFGKEVYKLSLDDVPEQTDFDLYNAGVREEGDRIALKLTAISKNKGEAILETREIFLFKVLPHIETKVGAVFIDPIAKTELSADFQFSPSYSLLFKGFFGNKRARRSIVYNRLLETSIGLHMAAPDFNKDDVPEIGTGLVLSTLNDYLQTGGGFNVFEGEFYWFFGLRIPFLSANPSSGSVNLNSN